MENSSVPLCCVSGNLIMMVLLHCCSGGSERLSVPLQAGSEWNSDRRIREGSEWKFSFRRHHVSRPPVHVEVCMSGRSLKMAPACIHYGFKVLWLSDFAFIYYSCELFPSGRSCCCSCCCRRGPERLSKLPSGQLVQLKTECLLQTQGGPFKCSLERKGRGEEEESMRERREKAKGAEPQVQQQKWQRPSLSRLRVWNLFCKLRWTKERQCFSHNWTTTVCV